jgi:hypothetical protein
VALSEELASRIEHANSRARGRLPGIGEIGAEDPGMSGAKSVGALSGNAYFWLDDSWFQSNMVSDPSNATMSSIVVI